MQHIPKPLNLSPLTLGLSLNSSGLDSYSLIASPHGLIGQSAGLAMTSGEFMRQLPGAFKEKPAGDELTGQLQPAKPFTTWSLFLISNPSWLRRDSADRIVSLYESYIAFARAIGEEHAAVWFGRSLSQIDLQTAAAVDLAATIDTEGCAQYAKRLNLDLAKGPHLLVTTNAPYLPELRGVGDHILLELNGLGPRSFDKLLASLARQLVTDKIDKLALNSKRYWLGWRDAGTRVLHRLRYAAGDVTIWINTGVLKVKLKPPSPLKVSAGSKKKKAARSAGRSGGRATTRSKKGKK